jgi:hypothetical protein
MMPRLISEMAIGTIDRLCVMIVDRAEQATARQFGRVLSLDGSLFAVEPPRWNNILPFLRGCPTPPI